MKSRAWMMAWGLVWLLAARSMGQSPVITSFHGNGQLSWTNAINSNALYRVEWSAQAGGPWCRTFDNIGSLDGLSVPGCAVPVPMFYRVAMATNQPPRGMVWIDGGDAIMGDTQGLGSSDELPVHTNDVSGFWMDETEVSKGKWTEVYNWAISYTFDNSGSGKANYHPAQVVNWYDCVKWCNARSQMEGLTPVYYTDAGFSTVYRTNRMAPFANWSANGYRLPTEAEWEKAARGGRQGRLFPWGSDTIQHAWANYVSSTNYAYDTSPTLSFHPYYASGGLPYTSPVGNLPANGFGLHDMAGNVAEWCWDWHAAYSATYETNPTGPATGTDRVLRGGSWYNDAFNARCSERGIYLWLGAPPEYTSAFVGFRCVRGP